jgi:hypothetical protein
MERNLLERPIHFGMLNLRSSRFTALDSSALLLSRPWSCSRQLSGGRNYTRFFSITLLVFRIFGMGLLFFVINTMQQAQDAIFSRTVVPLVC